MCQVVCHTLVSQTPNFLALLGDHLTSVLDLLGGKEKAELVEDEKKVGEAIGEEMN